MITNFYKINTYASKYNYEHKILANQALKMNEIIDNAIKYDNHFMSEYIIGVISTVDLNKGVILIQEFLSESIFKNSRKIFKSLYLRVKNLPYQSYKDLINYIFEIAIIFKNYDIVKYVSKKNNVPADSIIWAIKYNTPLNIFKLLYKKNGININDFNEILKYDKDKKKYNYVINKIDESFFINDLLCLSAVYNNNIDFINRAIGHKYPLNSLLAEIASKLQYTDMLILLCDNGCEMTSKTFKYAGNNLVSFKYLYLNDCPYDSYETLKYAIKHNDINMLKLMHKLKFPLDYNLLLYANLYSQSCYDYISQNLVAE